MPAVIMTPDTWRKGIVQLETYYSMICRIPDLSRSIMSNIENIEGILFDSLEILGMEHVDDPGYIRYGDLVLTVAPKVSVAQMISDSLVISCPIH